MSSLPLMTSQGYSKKRFRFSLRDLFNAQLFLGLCNDKIKKAFGTLYNVCVERAVPKKLYF